MPADQSAVERSKTLAYGGSDKTNPSFNRSRYVRHVSLRSSKDLGKHKDLNAEISGTLGGEHGSQSIFMRFETEDLARIALWGITSNRYLDQYISFAIQDEYGQFLTLDRLNSDIPARLLSLAKPGSYYNPIGGKLPAGVYRLTVTSNQWARISYRLQLVVQSSPELEGEASVVIQPSARLGLSYIVSDTSIELPASARLVVVYQLELKDLGAFAGLEIPATATVSKSSPFQAPSEGGAALPSAASPGQLVDFVSGLDIPKHDYIDLSYNGIDLTGIIYKLGGQNGRVVAVLTLEYDSNGDLVSINRS